MSIRERKMPSLLNISTDRPFWIAKIMWGHEDEEVTAKKVTAESFTKCYSMYCDDVSYSKGGKLFQALFSRFTDLQFHQECRAQFCKVIKKGGGVVPPSGNWNGIAISFVSGKEAVELSKVETKLYVARKEAERAGEDSADREYAAKLDSIKNTDRVLHYYFKQDYDYRGLDDTFIGTVTLADLIRVEQALLTDENEDELIKEVFGEGKGTYFSVTELFGDNNNKIVRKLSKGKTVSGSGEIGFEAISSTPKKAEKEVKDLFMEYEF